MTDPIHDLNEDFPHLSQIACSQRTLGREVKLEARRALAELAGLRKDVANLLTWKYEASLAIEEWEKLWHLLDRPGPLGASKAANVYREVAAARNRPAGRS